MAKSALIPVCLLMGACATSDQVASLKDRDFGPEPVATAWQPRLRARIEDTLRDPESARFKVGCPVRGYVKNALLSGGMGFQFVGYLVRFEVNAKNGFGGYTGFKPQIAALSRDGAVVMLLPSGDRGGFDHPLVTAIDVKQCEVPEPSTLDGSGVPARRATIAS